MGGQWEEEEEEEDVLSPETAFSESEVEKSVLRMVIESSDNALLTVDGDAHKIADLLDFATGDTHGAQVPQNEMVV